MQCTCRVSLWRARSSPDPDERALLVLEQGQRVVERRAQRDHSGKTQAGEQPPDASQPLADQRFMMIQICTSRTHVIVLLPPLRDGEHSIPSTVILPNRDLVVMITTRWPSI